VLAGPSSASSQSRITHGEPLDGHVEEGSRTTSLSTLRVHVRPARSIFGETLNFCCSAIAALVRSRDDIAHFVRQEGHRYLLRRRAIDSVPFSSLATGRASHSWVALRTDVLSEIGRAVGL